MGSNIQSALPGDGEAMPEEGSGAGGSSAMQAMIGLAIVAAAVGAYLLIKRRQKK
jgi:hypothetical protein